MTIGRVIERGGCSQQRRKAMEEKTGKDRMQSRAGVPVPEDRDPVMDKIAAGLREIIDTMPRRTHIRRVGWGWWYELQGVEPEPEDEPEFEGSDYWSIRDWFDRVVDQVFAKPQPQHQPTREMMMRRIGEERSQTQGVRFDPDMEVDEEDE